MLVGPACKLFTEDITEIPHLSEAYEDSTAVLSSVLVTLSKTDAILLSGELIWSLNQLSVDPKY